MTGAKDPGSAYTERSQRHAAEAERARSTSRRLMAARTLTFLACVAALVLADPLEGAAARAALAGALLLAVLFGVEVALHRAARRRETWHTTLERLCDEGLLRLSRDWTGLEGSIPARERAGESPEPGHPFLNDLHVLGRASLVRLMGPLTAEPARAILRGWLGESAAPEVTRARAEAAKELAPMLDQRLALAARGRLARQPDASALGDFLLWAEGQPPVGRGWIRVAAVALPLLVVPGGFAYFLGASPPWFVLPGLVQLWLLKRETEARKDDFRRVALFAPALGAYLPQLAAIEGWRMNAAALGDVRDRLTHAGVHAREGLAALARSAHSVEGRANAFYALLAFTLMLDVHLAARLDRWRARHGGAVRGWVRALGELEALCALGSLAHDHPDWTFAERDASALVVSAKDLGHPLLPPGACVRNDVDVGPPGRFLLVTGSNMSGKSTLLRAIGANMVLAGAGAPVCAASFRAPPLRVYTSMSIEDSLERGVSLFMAQLLRVRAVVEAAESGGVPVLFLFDEILHGTNSAERRIAARAVLTHLMSTGAVGAVTTHDLELAAAPELAAVADPVHFRETVERSSAGTRLSFDYRVRPGPATTSNALALLEALGLGPKE